MDLHLPSVFKQQENKGGREAHSSSEGKWNIKSNLINLQNHYLNIYVNRMYRIWIVKCLNLQAVENPNYSEIRDVIAAAGFVVGVENKKYCRERSNEPTVRGRIRVHFRNDDGSVINPKFPSRKNTNNSIFQERSAYGAYI